jgi:TorA maturation chaperone TorD
VATGLGPANDAADRARGALYTLLGQLLAKPPSQALLDLVAALRGEDDPLGQAIDTLAAAAATTSEPLAEREFNALFIGVERGELVPYAPFYLTGFLHERPLARLRQDMRGLGLALVPGVAEPEDHIASLCEIMAGLATGAFERAPMLPADRFFRRYLAPWAGQFFHDLQRSRSAELYRPVGQIGQLFIDHESDCLSERSIA